jgi:ribosome-binding protein aMBF1 (putative translation factor)
MNIKRRSVPESAGKPKSAGKPEPEPAGKPEPEPAGKLEPAGDDPGGSLPVMPGFREMTLRRSADEQAARMAEDRGRLVRELAEQRQAAGLSQTEIAARMGTSQSAVARLESGAADVRASTLERYAAAVGGQINWTLNRPGEGASE